MSKFYVYEIFLDEMLVINSGDMNFKTEEDATSDAIEFIQNLLKNDTDYYDCIGDDFDINVSEITEDDFVRGW